MRPALYRYDHSKLPPLDYAVNDVDELAALLRAGGYQVTLLRSGASNPKLVPTLHRADSESRPTPSGVGLRMRSLR